MQKERVLITGSEGLIGKVLVNSWRNIYDLVQLDIRAQNDGEKVFAADLSDLDSLKEVFRATHPLDAVVHLAGKPEHTTPWEEVLKNNIIGTRNIYECMAAFGVKKAVVVSSTHLQGGYKDYPQVSPLGRPITITDDLPPDSDYGTSKYFAEKVAHQFVPAPYNIRFFIVLYNYIKVHHLKQFTSISLLDNI